MWFCLSEIVLETHLESLEFAIFFKCLGKMEDCKNGRGGYFLPHFLKFTI